MQYKGAALDNHDFSGQDLHGADFRGASLVGARFCNANLTGAQFRGARVANADFTGANLTDTDLVSVRDAESAHWPDGFDLTTQLQPPKTTPRTEAERLHGVYFDPDGRLKEIPVGQTRQRFVLEHIVVAFTHGTRYSEREVNAILRGFHPDFATLRRYLIDHKLMARENNIYWRCEP